MNEKDLLKDQRGSPAYISPGILFYQYSKQSFFSIVQARIFEEEYFKSLFFRCSEWKTLPW